MVSRLAVPAARGTAVSILVAVDSLGTFVIAPAAQAMIDGWSWQGARGGPSHQASGSCSVGWTSLIAVGTLAALLQLAADDKAAPRLQVP